MMKKWISSFLILLLSSNLARADISNSTVSITDTTGNSIGSTGGSLNSNITNTVPVSQSGVWSVTVSGTTTSNQGTSPWVDNITQFGGSNVVTGTGVSGAGIPRVTVSNDSNILSTQSGAWSTGRTWTLLNSTDSVNAVQSGTWTVQQGTPPWSVSQSGTWNLNNISGTVSLPTGASTAANQTSVIGSATGGTAAVSSLLTGGVFNTVLPTITNSQQAALQLDSSARLIIAPLTTSSNVNVTQSTSPWVDNISQFGGSNVVTGTGISGAGIPRITVSSDSNILATQSGTWNLNNISGTVSLPTGASTSANQTNGNQKSQIVDGSGNVVGPVQAISGTNYQPVVLAASATPGAALVARSIQIAGSDGVNAQTISTNSSGQVNVNNISGTVSLPTGASLASNQTNGSQKNQIVDGSGNVIASTSNALNAFVTNAGQQLAAASIPVVTQLNASPATQTVTTQDLVSSSATGANNQSFITGTPTAGSAASFATLSFDSVIVQVTGTWTGTLQSEVSMDGGTTWFTRGLKQSGVGYISSSFTGNFQGALNVAGMTNYRVRATAAVTGTATIRVVSSIQPDSVTVTNPFLLKDGTTQSIINTIKPASTAALVTDTALVVAISPNNTVAVTQSTSPWVSNISQFGGSNVVTGTGTSGSGIPRVTVSSDSNVGLNAGTNAIGYNTGRAVLSTFTQNYGSVNLTTGAFITIISSTSATINEIDIFDNSGGVYYLAYAATCGALSTSSNAIIVNPGGGIKDFAIPSGNCVGFEALGTNITSGNVYMTFYK